MTPIDSLSPFMPIPAEMWAHITGYLPFQDARNFGKTCPVAQEVFKEFASDRDIEKSIPVLLEQETFSLASMPNSYRKNKKFVCTALRIDGDNFDAVDKTLHKDAQVLKTAAVAQFFFGKGIDPLVEQKLNEEGGGQFLDSLNTLSHNENCPDRETWKTNGLELLFDCGVGAFKDDREVIFSAMRYCSEDVLNHLSEIEPRSALLDDPKFMFKALRVNPNIALKKLNSPKLLNDPEFIHSVLDYFSSFNSKLVDETLSLLGINNSTLLNDPEFIHRVLDHFSSSNSSLVDKIFSTLESNKSTLLNNLEFMRYALNLCYVSTILRILEKTNSTLLKNPDFMRSALRRSPSIILEYIFTNNSCVWNPADFAIEACQHDLGLTLSYLQNKLFLDKFGLLENRDFMLKVLALNAEETLDHIENSNPLKRDPIFINAVIESDINLAYQYGYIGYFGTIFHTWIKNPLQKLFG